MTIEVFRGSFPNVFLTLSIRNAFRLDNGAPLSVVLEQRGAIIGRGGVDWQLPDPDRHISSRHCEIQYVDGHYELVDYSTNGTFLLGDATRMKSPHVIASGDVFRIGRYEIAASLAPAGSSYGRGSLRRPASPMQPRPIGGAGSWQAPAHGVARNGSAHGIARGGGSLARPVAVAQNDSWPERVVPIAAPVPAADGERALVAALGLSPGILPAGDPEPMGRAGRVLRRMVAGLLVVLAGRTQARQEIGLPGTQFRFEGNNPLKFARNPEEALERLLVPPQSGYIEGETGVERAFRDIETHQTAMLKAMQVALDAVSARFGPAAIREGAGPGADPAALWAHFERAFDGTPGARETGFAEAFAMAFRRAYSEAAGSDH